jgi:glycosyltransferase involved in cell wall biosynthesis
MVIVQLMASPFVGGPERQMLGLARHLPSTYRTAFLSFPERGLCRPFLNLVRERGFEGVELRHNTPNFRKAISEVAGHLRRVRADLVCCSGYKPDLIGWRAARQVGVPVVSVSHGWTAATLKVRLYEVIDRLFLRWLDAVVCVSEGQANRVRRVGVPAERVVVIRNAIDPAPYEHIDHSYRRRLEALFPVPPACIIGAAGRLSPEKGFDQLIQAAARIVQVERDAGFVVFGDGPLREDLTQQIVSHGLQDRFILAGFRTDLEKWLPHFEVAVLPSFTEGLPVIVLEAFAAGVPVVATAVGGTPEVVTEGRSGYLVRPGDPVALAERVVQLLHSSELRKAMGQRGRERVRREFTFAAQSEQYQQLFEKLLSGSHSGRAPGRARSKRSPVQAAYSVRGSD